jgi:hypothetical protein
MDIFEFCPRYFRFYRERTCGEDQLIIVLNEFPFGIRRLNLFCIKIDFFHFSFRKNPGAFIRQGFWGGIEQAVCV